jgi:hypothetical protein
MRRQLSFPVVMVEGEEWLELSAHGMTHEICGEKVNHRPDPSFAGGHRVRQYSFRKNVHWLFPTTGKVVDIRDVAPEPPPKPAAKKKRK